MLRTDAYNGLQRTCYLLQGPDLANEAVVIEEHSETKSMEEDRNQKVPGDSVEPDGVSEIDALRRIYVEICAIRQKHADLVSENARKRAEHQQRLDAQKKRLEQLLEQHRETGHQLKALSSGSEEQRMLMVKYREEKDELETQRRLLDDLEFKMFEADAYYDEQKELIQQQLMSEQKRLTDVENQHRRSSIRISSETSPALSDQPPAVNTPPSEVSQPADAMGVTLTNHMCVQDPIFSDGPLSYPVDPFSDSNNQQRATPVDDKLCTPPAESRIPPNAEELQPEEELDRFQEDGLPGSPTSSGSLTLPPACCQPSDSAADSFLRVPYGCERILDSDECSSSSSERRLDTEAEVNERIRQMRILLAAAEAEKARLLREQTEQNSSLRSDDGDSSRRVEFDESLLSDDLVSQSYSPCEDSVRLRDHARTQSRPLTRYLPMRDQQLDLIQFVEQAGHYVQRCADDITVTPNSARGFLVKQGGHIRTWRRRWFVFDRLQRHLAYYVDQSEQRRPKGCIKFSVIEDVFVFDRLSSVKSPAPDLTFCVKTSKRTYYIVAPNTEARQLWMDIIFTGAEGYREFT